MVHYAIQDAGTPPPLRGSKCDYRMVRNLTTNPHEVTCQRCVRWIIRTVRERGLKIMKQRAEERASA